MSDNPPPDLSLLLDRLQRTNPLERRGRIVSALGTTVRVLGIEARIGQSCLLRDVRSGSTIMTQVVGITTEGAVLTPLGDLQGLSIGAEVVVGAASNDIAYGTPLLGRVLDGLGDPIDGLAPLPSSLPRRPLFAAAPAAMARASVNKILPTGVRAIDALLTLGIGQRLGVFAAAGGGKSTLLAMLARHARADVIVIGLIGERGREVREFVEDVLGADGLRRAVVICATSDRSAMERVRAAHHATAIAEGFRADGANVLLLIDSVTRFARALREIGLAAGEPAVRRGFPPSVFAELPRLFERAGNDHRGSITAIYTVLLEDEEGGDPVGEEVRSILDGHIILSRELGARGHYPAIDVLASLSRLFTRLADADHRDAATRVRAMLAKHDEIKFLLQLGEYKPGADILADAALAAMPEIEALLRQQADDPTEFDVTRALLRGVAG